MLFWGMAIDAYIVKYCNNAGEMVCCLVHTHLKDIQGHLQTKWNMQEPVSAMMGIKHCQIQTFFIKVNTPEAILSIQLTEAGSIT